MTVQNARPGRQSLAGRILSQRWVAITAAATAAVLTAGAIATAGGGSAGAATPLSQATGRFLSGSVGGQSLDTVAGIEGESAVNPGDAGPNQNSLNAEVLNGALKIPLGAGGLQLPDPTAGAIGLGAVAQYAQANADGSALGASGAVDSNGGIGVGGSDGVPTGGATIDLGGSQAISAVTSQLANLKLTIGAVTARAAQVAIGKTIADPSAGCVNGPYRRVSDPDQAGSYNIAALGLDLTSPLLAQIGSTLVTTIDGLLTTANLTSILTTLNGSPLGGVITVTGVPDVSTLVDRLLELSLAGGAITVSLATGALHVNLKALLSFLNLDINDLCPNTALLPYLVTALLDGLPAVLTGLVSELNSTLTTALGGLTITVLGVPISAGLLTGLLITLGTTINDTLTSALGSLDTRLLPPLLDVLTDNVLNVVVNRQGESGGTLTQTAVQLNVLPGGASVAARVPAFRTLPAIKDAKTNSIKTAARVAAHRSTKKASSVQRSAKLTAMRALAAPTDALVVLDLAQATVGPNSAAPPSPRTAVPATNLPTGVPAGRAAHGGNPVLPITLLALGLMFAAGGAVAVKRRGRLNSH